MTAKNIITYISITLIGLIGQLISYIFYWIPFLFRHKILRFAQARFENDEITQLFILKPGVKKWKLYIHPYFWMFCFTTGLDDNYCGPGWYKKELKEKWFIDWENTEWLANNYPQFLKFHEKLKYFYLCYSWQGFRNAFYGWNEWWREGKAEVEYNMPDAKFKDADGNYRDNSGPYIRYPFDDPDNQWMTTQEGNKLIIFTTYKGNERFYFGYCKISKGKKKFWVTEILIGWNWWNGIRETRLKFMAKIMDELALADYNKYKKNEQNKN